MGLLLDQEKVHITEGTLGKMKKHYSDLANLVDRAMALKYVGRRSGQSRSPFT